MVRINIIVPESEREAFDKWCRYGGKPKVSMNARLRALLNADARGQINVPRAPTPRRGGQAKRK